MNQDNLTTVITSQEQTQDIPHLDQLSTPVDQLVAALDEVVTQPLTWWEEKKEDDKGSKQQPDLLAAADSIAIDIPMAPADGSLQNIDTSYQSGYSGYDGGGEGLPPAAVFGLGILGVGAVAAALSSGGSSGGGNNKNGGPTISVQSPLATQEDTPIVFNVNATDPNDDPLEITFNQLNGGTVSATAGIEGQYTFTPFDNFNGVASFQVAADDGRGGTDFQSVVVNISAVNDAPTSPGALNVTTAKGQSIEIDASTGVFDPEGDPISFNVTTNPSNGTLQLVAGSPGEYVYTPNAQFEGTDQFIVTISDGTLSTTRTVQVSTGGNLPPVADASQSVTLDEDTPTTIGIGASDPNNDNLTFTISALPSNGSAQPTANGSVLYTPAADFFGNDSFEVTISDGNGGSVVQTVDLVINSVNDAPEVDDVQSVTVLEGSPVDVNIGATDAEGDTLSYNITQNPNNGTVTDNGDGSYTYTPSDGDFIGIDTFVVTVSDGNGGNSSQEVRISFTADNDAPTVDATQSVSTASSAPVNFTVDATDAEGDALRFAAASANSGTIVPGSTPGQFTYRPNQGFSGQDTFNILVSDGNGGVSTQAVTVTVAPTSGEDSNLTQAPDGAFLATSDDADVIRGTRQPSGSTLNESDNIDGEGGFDTLVVNMQIGFPGFSANANPLIPNGSMTNVEGLQLSNAAAGGTTFNASRISGLEYLQLDANDRNFAYSSLGDTNLVFELIDADSVNPANVPSLVPTLTYTLGFAPQVNDGEDDSLTLVLNDVGRRNTSTGVPDDGVAIRTLDTAASAPGAPVNSDIENLTIVANSGQNFIDLAALGATAAPLAVIPAALQTLTIGGSGDLDTAFFHNASINGVAGDQTPFANLSRVDASSALGDLDLALFSNVLTTRVDAGFGDDIIRAGNNIRSTSVLNGGDGDDLLILTGINDLAGTTSVTLAPTVTGFETIDLSIEDGFTAGRPQITNFVFSTAKISGLQKIQFSDPNGVNAVPAGPGPGPAPDPQTNTTIRDLNGRDITLSFLETSGNVYTGNDTYVVQDSGTLNIETVSQNNNSSGSFVDNVQAVAAPIVNLNVGADTTYGAIGGVSTFEPQAQVTANAADSATINLGAGSAINGVNFSLTSADRLDINGATDTVVNNLYLNAENITEMSITGSVIINGFGNLTAAATTNLNSLTSVVSTSLGGLDLRFPPITANQSGIGAFSDSVSVDAAAARVATTSGFGLDVVVANYLPGNGTVNITGSSVLDNRIVTGVGRNQITINTGDGDDLITILEQFEQGDGATLQIAASDGLFDQVTLAAGDNIIDSLTMSGVESVLAGNNSSNVLPPPFAPSDSLTVNASSVSDQPVTFVDFLSTTFLGTSGGDSINMERVNGAATNTIDGLAGSDTIIGTDNDDIIVGGEGSDILTGRQGDNTYVYNTGDVGAGETINFNASTTETETISVLTSTDFSALNGGGRLTLLDAVTIAEAQTASFLVEQLRGPTAPVVTGVAGGEDEIFQILGTSSGEVIDLNSLQFTIGVPDVSVAINAGAGADIVTGRTSIENYYIYNTGDIVAGEEVDIVGGGNADTFVVETSVDFSELNGGNLVLGGLDTLDIAANQSAFFNAAQITGLTMTVLGDGNNGGESITVTGKETADNIDLSLITVDANDVTITINGLEDDDSIRGSNANEVINGGGGLDTLDGNRGADTYTGGANSDTFVHNFQDGVAHTAARDLGADGISDGDEIGFGNSLDKIMDFEDGTDFIDLDIARADLNDNTANVDFDLANASFGISDDGFAVIRGNFDGTEDDVFYADQNGSDLLFAFDANAASGTVDVEFIGLIGVGGITFDQNDILA